MTQRENKMKKIGIILANEMRDVDLFVPLAIWRKSKIAVDLISIEKKNSVMMESGVKVGCNSTFDIVNTSQYNALYFPGGTGVDRLLNGNWPVKNSVGPTKLFKSLEAFRLNANKFVLVTSSSSKIIHDNHLIGKSRIAGFTKDYRKDESIQEEIVINHNLVSVLGYYQLTEFALQVVELLQGQEIRSEIEASLEFDY